MDTVDNLLNFFFVPNESGSMTCLILCAYLYTDILVVVDESGHLVVVQHVTVNTVLTVDHCFFAKPG